MLAGGAATPASRIVKTGNRSFAIIPRENPIPAEATVVNTGADILSSWQMETVIACAAPCGGGGKQVGLWPGRATAKGVSENVWKCHTIEAQAGAGNPRAPYEPERGTRCPRRQDHTAYLVSMAK